MKPSIRILVVEDETVVARDLQTRLARLGYNVVDATARGDSAIVLAERHNPDLVLMDIRLQGQIDGITAADVIRCRYHLPVVYLTAHADEQTIDRARATEPFGYILKPFDERELRIVIEMALYKHQAERKLQLSERRYATTLSSIGDGVIATDQTGRVTFLNPVAEGLTGWSAEDAKGKPLTEMFRIVNEQSRAIVAPPVERVLREGIVAGLANHTVLTNRHGSEAQIDGCAAPIQDDRGVSVGAVLVFRDVTETHRREKQLRQSQKMEAIGQLAAGISHDFNNMLTAILGYTELLLDMAGSDHPWIGFLTEIQKASHRSAELTRQLLRFSRKELSQAKVIDLNRLIIGIEPMLKRLVGEQIDLQIRMAELPASIKADPGQLEQVLVNLVVNARDALPNGGLIFVETAREWVNPQSPDVPLVIPYGEYQVLQVIDNGSGMDSETKLRIFEPFFTTKEVGKGTGLGLSIVYGIVQACRGYIHVESTVGQGTKFKIWFPTSSDELVQQPIAAVSDLLLGTETVLLVEDEPTVRSFAKQVLVTCGYTVLEAEHGAHGVEVAESYSGTIDLIVTDLVMPYVGGVALLTRLKSVRPGIKVLYMSGYASPQFRPESDPHGEATVLQKPFTPKAFADAVHHAIRG
ncbi:MAG: response regulator [Pirellulaceae bacterium]|nr:response regulator [Pirellulaceae bacterium]